MSRFLAQGGWVVSMAALLAAGCWGGAPARVVAPEVDAAAAGTEAVAQYDANKDGKIAGAELDAVPALKIALPKLNPGGSSVDAAQITARINQVKESKVGRMSVAMTVTRRGKGPLVGATVTLIPEKFMGDALPTCSGTTDEGGSVSPKPANAGPRESGVPPGFYRVEITKAGDKIPEKYNTKTTLGLEVANDAVGMESGVTYTLEY